MASKTPRQSTLDAMDRLEEQNTRIGPKHSDVAARHFGDVQTFLAKHDRAVILDGIRKDPGTRRVAQMAKCSLDEAAERIWGLVVNGYMTVGMVEGQIRVGVTKEGWRQFAMTLR